MVCKDLIFSNCVVKPNCQTLSASIRLHILVVPTWEAFYFQENSFVWFFILLLGFNTHWKLGEGNIPGPLTHRF